MKSKDYKPLIISAAITVIEFLAFLVWGKTMQAGDEMGFFIITTYLLFPLTTLILSAYLGNKSPVMLIPFIIIMFAAQNFMPFLLTNTFEVGMTFLLTFIPALVGAGIGIALRAFRNRVDAKKEQSNA